LLLIIMTWSEASHFFVEALSTQMGRDSDDLMHPLWILCIMQTSESRLDIDAREVHVGD
jgi:hypothetical protein